MTNLIIALTAVVSLACHLRKDREAQENRSLKLYDRTRNFRVGRRYAAQA